MKLTELKQSSFTNHTQPLTERIHERKESLQQKEKQWVQNFHMMCSKDNTRYPKTMRELFEKPLSYDINMTRKSAFSSGISCIRMAGKCPTAQCPS